MTVRNNAVKLGAFLNLCTMHINFPINIFFALLNKSPAGSHFSQKKSGIDNISVTQVTLL